MKDFYVYILTNRPRGTYYVGVTSDLKRRVWEHREGVTGGFTSKYNVRKLVYYEVFQDAENAIKREKRLKHWTRDSKNELIKADNPDWQDLYPEL